MEPTYSDMYVLFDRDPAAEAYFAQLPGYIQAQIRAREHQPASLEELKRMAYEGPSRYSEPLSRLRAAYTRVRLFFLICGTLPVEVIVWPSKAWRVPM